MAVSRLLPLFVLLTVAAGAYDGAGQPPISRRSFPEGFIFGASSASYQVNVLSVHSYVHSTCSWLLAVHFRTVGLSNWCIVGSFSFFLNNGDAFHDTPKLVNDI